MCNTLRAYFEGKKHLFEDLKNSFEAMVELLSKWYDSYLFHEEGTKGNAGRFKMDNKKNLQGRRQFFEYGEKHRGLESGGITTPTIKKQPPKAKTFGGHNHI